MRGLAVRFLGLLVLVSALSQASPIYSVIDLGNLGGGSATGFQVNSAGTVVGWADTVTGAMHAFVAAPNQSIQPLPATSPGDSHAYGINGAAVIVGTTYINGQAHGTVWTGSSVTDLGAGVFAMGINDAGAIVGSNGHAFKLVNGTYQDLGTLPGGDWSAAYGVNDSGTAVGYGDVASGLFRAIVWNPDGTLVQLGTLGGANSYAAAVNDAAQVVGHSEIAGGYDHAFLDTNGTLQDLGTLDGGCSYAYGINDGGTVVGYSWSEAENNPRAFAYAGGLMQDLNALIPAGSGWQLYEAYGINALGEITGVGLFDGQVSAFLLQPMDPVPEPGGLSVILLAMGLFAGNIWRAECVIVVRRS